MPRPTTPRESQPSLPGLLAAFAAVYFIWGSTYLGIRFAIETIPPYSMAGLRFLSAGLILFGWTSLCGHGRPTLVQWRSALIVGVLLLVSGNGLLTWAELVVPSGVAALIVATVPLWMVLLDSFTKEGSRPNGVMILGLLLGLAGIFILIGPDNLGGSPVDPVGAAAICFAAFSWALGSIYSKKAPQVSSTLQNVGMQMILGGLVLLGLGTGLGERIDWSAISPLSAWALVYLSIVGGIVSYSAYVWLLKVSTPAKVSTYAYINPVVAVVLGWAFAGEALDARVLLASGAVVAAVFLIIRAGARRASPSKMNEPEASPVVLK